MTVHERLEAAWVSLKPGGQDKLALLETVRASDNVELEVAGRIKIKHLAIASDVVLVEVWHPAALPSLRDKNKHLIVAG